MPLIDEKERTRALTKMYERQFGISLSKHPARRSEECCAPLAGSAKLLAALKRGRVRGIGGTIYDPDMNYLMTNTDMYHAVHALCLAGVKVERIDAGGSPTWEIVSPNDQAQGSTPAQPR